MRYYRLLQIGMIVLASFSSYGQNIKEILTRLNQHYVGQDLRQVNMQYRLFKGHDFSDIVQTYQASYVYNETFSYRKMDGVEIICQDSMQLKIDHEFKEIDISHASAFDVLNFDIKEMLKCYEDVKIIPIPQKQHYVVDISIKNDNAIPYSRIRMTLDKDFLIKSIRYHYVNQVNFGTFSQPDYHLPVLEVTFTDFQKVKEKTKLPSIDQFISRKDNAVEGTINYINYTITDFRR